MQTADAPAWYLQPTQNGVIGGVGEAGFHIRGVAAQRQLAISRAINEIASQMGIKVANIQEIRSVATEQTSASEVSGYSIHSTSGVTVRAQIKEFWQDRDRIVVWMVVY